MRELLLCRPLAFALRSGIKPYVERSEVRRSATTAGRGRRAHRVGDTYRALRGRTRTATFTAVLIVIRAQEPPERPPALCEERLCHAVQRLAVPLSAHTRPGWQRWWSAGNYFTCSVPAPARYLASNMPAARALSRQPIFYFASNYSKTSRHSLVHITRMTETL